MHLHIATDEVCRNAARDLTYQAAQCGSIMTADEFGGRPTAEKSFRDNAVYYL